MPDLYLASQSPRRRELLHQIGVQHQVIAVNVAEVQKPAETPAGYVQRLAADKSVAGWRAVSEGDLPLRPVLGADTLIELDGEVLEKPACEAQAVAMMARLSGRSHRVLTAVALTDGRGTRSVLSSTQVWFRPVSEAEARRYWRTGEPSDKAGGYAIQGLGAVFVTRLDGSYSGVVGLPLAATQTLLADAGVPCWQETASMTKPVCKDKGSAK